MTYRILHEKDGTIIVTPTNESNQTATIVICHGLGDTAEGFADVAEVIRNWENPLLLFEFVMDPA